MDLLLLHNSNYVFTKLRFTITKNKCTFLQIHSSTHQKIYYNINCRDAGGEALRGPVLCL